MILGGRVKWPACMLQLLNAGLTAQALHVVAALGIADRLAGGWAGAIHSGACPES